MPAKGSQLRSYSRDSPLWMRSHREYQAVTIQEREKIALVPWRLKQDPRLIKSQVNHGWTIEIDRKWSDDRLLATTST